MRDLSKFGHIGSSGAQNEATDKEGLYEKAYHSTDTENGAKRDVRTRRREGKRRRRKAEIYVRFCYFELHDIIPTVRQITRHISSLISRQMFILKLARAMMMFGGPTHRLQAQIQSTAHVLEISLSCLYLPDVMLIAFDDDITSTSSVKLIRQSSALDLGKLQGAHKIYWGVCVYAKVGSMRLRRKRRLFMMTCLSQTHRLHWMHSCFQSLCTHRCSSYFLAGWHRHQSVVYHSMVHFSTASSHSPWVRCSSLFKFYR